MYDFLTGTDTGTPDLGFSMPTATAAAPATLATNQTSSTDNGGFWSGLFGGITGLVTAAAPIATGVLTSQNQTAAQQAAAQLAAQQAAARTATASTLMSYLPILLAAGAAVLVLVLFLRK